MKSVKKSQVSPIFLNQQYRYDEMYVAKFFFYNDIRMIMSLLPWGIKVTERDILKATRKYKLRAEHTRHLIRFLLGAGVVERSWREEWHISLSFDDIYSRQHRIPKKYLKKFFNRITYRTFLDVAYEIETEDDIRKREALRQTIAIQSSSFIASFGECGEISQYMQHISPPALYRFSLYSSCPIYPSQRLVQLYFSIIAYLLDMRGILLESLYECESDFTPFSVFGIYHDDLVSLINSTPGLSYDRGVVWIVDFYFGAVYNFVTSALHDLFNADIQEKEL